MLHCRSRLVDVDHRYFNPVEGVTDELYAMTLFRTELTAHQAHRLPTLVRCFEAIETFLEARCGLDCPIGDLPVAVTV
jgi:hypothetical protein